MNDPRILSGPFWAEMRVFLAVAKAKSYSKAGEELGMSRPKISRSVHRLQDMIGVVLLVPSTSGITLTEKGKELVEKLLPLDQLLFSVSNDLRAETREMDGVVRVTATEAMAGFFIVPSLVPFGQQYPKIRAHVRNPVTLLNLHENQCDIMVGFGPLPDPDLESRAVGFLHLVGAASQSYIEEHGMPTWDALGEHRFVDSDYYASRTPAFAPWRNAVEKGIVAHHCDNSFAYGLSVKAGLGIGLLSNYVLADTDFVPVGMGIHIKLPIHLHATAERLKSRPVRIMYEWLADIFSADRAVFGSELSLGASPRDLVPRSLQHLMMWAELAQQPEPQERSA